jgi:hypothetical protein
MCVTKPLKLPLAARRALLCALCGAALSVSPALAQQLDAPPPPADDAAVGSLESTVWLFDAPTLPARTTAELEQQLAQVLGAERARHILGTAGLADHLKRRPAAPPACLKGALACGSPTAMTYDALGISVVIRVKLRSANGRLEAAYTLRDRRGQETPVRIASAPTPRELALVLVRDIYKATGKVELRSTPPGARVFVDGAELGVTPVELPLPIGLHDITFQLAEHQPVERRVEVVGEQSVVVEAALSLLGGLLVLEGLPPDATVSIDGGAPQPAQQPLELGPGEHKIEVRAPGHEPARDVVTIAPGQTVTRPLMLVRINPLLRDISREDILYNRYLFQLTYDHTFESTSFRSALSQEDNVSIELRRFANRDGEANPKRFIDPNGLRLQFDYFGESFGLTVLSLAYLSDTRSFPVTLEYLSDGTQIEAKLTDITRIQIRPFGLNWRFIYKNLAPRVELGSGVTFESVTVSNPQLATPVSLSRVEPFWTFGLGVQYYLSPRWYVSARYGFLDYFNAGVGVEHSLSFGVGLALPNLFGVEPEPPEQL